jgi:hypothetical protein
MSKDDVRNFFDFLNFMKKLQEIEKKNLEIQQLKSYHPPQIVQVPVKQPEGLDTKLLQALLEETKEQTRIAQNQQMESLVASRDMVEFTLYIMFLTGIMVACGFLQLLIGVAQYLK